MTKIADTVLAQIPEYVKTRRVGEHFLDFLAQLACDHPEYREKLVLLGSFFVDPAQGYRLFQALEQLVRKIKGAAFADYPEAYIWRPIVEGVLTFRDCKDGTADLGDVIRANEVLDYFKGRDSGKAEAVLNASHYGMQEKPVLRMVRQLLQSGQLPRNKNGKPNISQTAILVSKMITELQPAKRGRTYKTRSSHMRALVKDALSVLPISC